MNLTKASLLLLTCGACSGVLVIPEPKAPAIPCETSAVCGTGLVCDAVLKECVVSPGGCQLTQPAGDCPRGRVCVDGNCLCADADVCTCSPRGCPPPTWCQDCLPTQACDADGLCKDIVGDECSPSNLDGLCCCDQICVGGYCVPIETPCSDEYPDGFCQMGFSCVDSRCVPTIDRPCSHADPTGLCPSGQECQAPGQCDIVQCAPGKLGACEPDLVCSPDCTQPPCCEQLPCSPQHLGGRCDNGQYCSQGDDRPGSQVGVCLDPGVCGGDRDCGPNQYCGTTQACFDYGDCAVDADCEVEQSTLFGQGYECPAGLCVERFTCDVPADCRPAKFCSSGGNCLFYPLCDGALDCPAAGDPPEICSMADAAQLPDYATACTGLSVCHVCIDQGTCLTKADCTGGYICSHDTPHVCIPPDECRVDSDCAPGRACDTTTEPLHPHCVVTGTPCSTNTFKYSGCAANQLSCCDSASAGDCCAAGQICSLVPSENVCIPFGKCVVATDCLTGYFDCVDFECVSTRPCAGCLADEICSTAGGCVPDDRCAADADCALGERCNANWRCEPVPECGLKPLSGGSLLPPNILVALDRSASMQICGPGVSSAGCCGYCPAGIASCANPVCTSGTAVCGTGTPACSDPLGVLSVTGTPPNSRCSCTAGSATCSGPDQPYTVSTCSPGTVICTSGIANCSNGTPACTSGGVLSCVGHGTPYFDWEPSCSTGTPTCLNGTTTFCHTGENPSDITSRWSQAVTAVKQVLADQAGKANFGLTIFPGQSVVTCNSKGIPRCYGTPGCTSGGTLSCEGTDPSFTPQCTVGSPICTESCSTDCNYNSCSNSFSFDAGVIDVPVGLSSQTAINSRLDATVPGGATPTSQTLRAIAANPAASGLASTSTQNAILLVTDGEANADQTPAQQRVCEPPCSDNQKNGDETDRDCGGSCSPCADAKNCMTNTDCQSQVCRLGGCRPLTCANGLKNGDETDTDCGGSCGPCADGAACGVTADCGSSRCLGGFCQTASCTDSIKNGGETDADCGGTCTAKCADDKSCLVDSDCTAGHPCQTGICRPATCVGTCGGATCGRCPDGQTCSTASDCQSNYCPAATCTRPPCSDGIRNGWETDVDCGTADVVTCRTSSGTPTCLGGTPGCTSGGTISCVALTPTCTVGSPTCGGGTGCAACAGGKICDSSADCLSGACRLCNTTEYPCKVNSVLDQLYASSPRVSTYVVAYNFASGNLNCHAFHGRTAKRDVCPGLTAANCATETNICYYDTQQLADLQQALADIVEQVRGCSFLLPGPPPSSRRLYLYLQSTGGTPGIPNVTRVERYVGWDFDGVNNTIGVFGAACDAIKSGSVIPLVIYGCYCEEC
jgi:hypothetical protein